MLGCSQDAGGRGWNRLAPSKRAALQLLGHSTLEASAGLIGHRPDLLTQLLVRRHHHHHLLDAYPLRTVRSRSRMSARRDHYGSSVRVKSSMRILCHLWTVAVVFRGSTRR